MTTERLWRERRGLRASGSLLLAIIIAGCGGRTDLDSGASTSTGDASTVDAGGVTFPLGTYARCARGLYNPDGNVFLNTSGFEPGSALTLTQSGSTVTASYLDLNGKTSSWDFVLTSDTSATLFPSGQTLSDYGGLCVLGVGFQNEKPFPAVMSASTGALSYDSGTVFVSFQGTLEGDGGECGQQSTPASVWLVCDDGPSPAPSDEAPTPVTQIPQGTYTCNSQVETFYEHNGQSQYVGAGGDAGSLTLTEAGGDFAASYSGDPYIAGLLHFGAQTATTATARPDQSVSAPCLVPITTGGGLPATPETLAIRAASLMLNDSTLFFSFAGAMSADSSCPGAKKAGSLLCTKP